MRPGGSIISQLLVACSAFAVLVAVAAVVGYAGLHRQNSAARQHAGRDYALQQAAGLLQRDFTASQLSISRFALSGRGAVLRPVGRSRADFAAQLAILQRDAPSPLRGLVTTQARAGARLFTVADQIGKLPPASPQASGLAGGMIGIAGSFYAANSRLQAELAADVRQLTAASTHSLSAWPGARPRSPSPWRSS